MCDGAIGSGKTQICMSAWIEDLWSNRGKNRDYILTGYTLGALERNILQPLKDDFGIDSKVSQEGVFPIFGNRMNCFGTDKSHSYKAIRGIKTAHGHYANELVLSHRTAIDECRNRCRGDGVRYFYETNPDGQTHWVYQTMIRPWEQTGNTRDLARFNFTIYDNDKRHNGFLPDEFIKQQEDLYTGVLRRKYLMGEWCSIDGQIYYLEALQYYDDGVTADPHWFEGGQTHGYLDPAAGSQKRTGCFTSLISGVRKGDNIYLIDAVVRKIGIAGIIQAVGERLGIYTYTRLAYEDNFTQDEYVGRPLKDAYPFAPITGQSSREDKLSRLVAMQHTIQTRVFFPERWRTEKNSDGWLLLQQLTNITATRTERAETDENYLDGPDALEGLIRTFNQASIATQGSMKTGGEKRKELNW